jgi:FkbM family methyltransferase
MPAWMASPKNRIQLNARWTYQGVKQKAFLQHCTSRRTVIDVGGHVGLWSFNFSHSFKQVHAFEPVAAHRECFALNVEQPNVKLHACALGAEAGSVSMWTEQGSSGNTQVRGAGDIPMRLLDSFEFTDVDAIKIDCEGYEENVLRGAVETLARWKPVVIVEQKRDMAARFDLPLRGAVDFLKTLGYRVAQEISGDFIMVPA